MSSSSCSQSYGKSSSLLDHDEAIKKLCPGDLIEIHRGKFQHWTICESVDSYDAECYHITIINSAKTEPGNKYVGKYLTEDTAVLRREHLYDILLDQKNKTFSKCTIKNQKECAAILLAKYGQTEPNLDSVFKMLGQFIDAQFKYSLFHYNCEHYCTFFKYGIGWSSQVKQVKELFLDIIEFVDATSRNNKCTRIFLPLPAICDSEHLITIMDRTLEAHKTGYYYREPRKYNPKGVGEF